ncbi:MAG: lipopolysaccharide biosynthesis protein [Hyphomicrobiales bacterium]
MWTGALFALNALLNLGLALALAWALPASAYGAFTVYFAAALLVGDLSYDWVRFSAVRFYTPVARVSEPALRATLDVSLAASTGIMIALAMLISVSGALPAISAGAFVGLIAVTGANAAFEYWTALCRARFDTRRYAVMVVTRNVLTFGLTVPVAALTGSFTMALAAFAVAVVPSVLYGAARLKDKEARPALAARAQAARFASYAAPLVLAEGCYLVIAAANRTFLAHEVSLAEAGAYALTFDLAFRVLAVTASVGDAVLFPRLVANLHIQGAARTREEIARNIAVMLLVLAPAAMGFALVAEPLAELVLAEHFREAFARFAPVAIVAAFVYTAQTFVLRPAFQVELRTADMPLAAVAALLVDLAMLMLLPGDGLLAASCAHLAGMCVGLALVLRRAIAARLVDWPLRDIGKIAVSVALLAVCVAALRFEGRPFATLLARAACGACVYGAAAWLLDAAGLRSLLISAARPSRDGQGRNAATGATPI